MSTDTSENVARERRRFKGKFSFQQKQKHAYRMSFPILEAEADGLRKPKQWNPPSMTTES